MSVPFIDLSAAGTAPPEETTIRNLLSEAKRQLPILEERLSSIQHDIAWYQQIVARFGEGDEAPPSRAASSVYDDPPRKRALDPYRLKGILKLRSEIQRYENELTKP